MADELAQLRAELASLRAMLAGKPAGVYLPPDATQAQRVAAGALVLPGSDTRGGEIVSGTRDKTQRELLSAQGQTFFKPSTDKPDANLRWDDWRRLAALLPSDFNEEKYLRNNPEVAKAVRRRKMPSGAWHYVMYGMPGCQAGAKKGYICENRSFAGWRGLSGYRRPGYLAGFSPWS